jgi:SAM-dependent methyltransferase
MKIRCEYESAGTADAFYQEKGDQYRNPQEQDVRKTLRKRLKVDELQCCLDLACGSGEATLEIENLGGGKTTMIDPYCFAAAEQSLGVVLLFSVLVPDCSSGVGRPCLRYSFEDIANGMVEGIGPFSAIVCSFALHLLDESYLPALLAVLSGWSSVLIVLTPHKRPHLKEEWGWILQG